MLLSISYKSGSREYLIFFIQAVIFACKFNKIKKYNASFFCKNLFYHYIVTLVMFVVYR